MFPAAPPVVHQIANSPKVTKDHLKSVMSITSGGAYLPPVVADTLTAKTGHALEIATGYGLSEAVRLPTPYSPLPPSRSRGRTPTDIERAV